MFSFALAAHLGMIREEMMSRMSAAEFQQWRIYASLNPFGDSRMDFLFAMLASTVANMSGKSLKKDQPISDFMPDFLGLKQGRRQTPEEMHANFIAVLNAAKRKAS